MVGSVASREPRKLSTSAYLSSAKIHIVSRDPARYLEAQAMLDSLFMHYGPVAEGLYWKAQMAVDGIESSSNPMAKEPYVATMVAYRDSLHMCCNNEDIKKKYRKGCDGYTAVVDSIAVMYWTEFYNSGIEQLNKIADYNEEMRLTEDSSMIAFNKAGIEANFDSCVANMQLAIACDPTDARTYIGIGSAYQGQEKFDEAIEWKKKGLDMLADEDKPDMQLSIAYDYINSERYEEAIPFMNLYVEADTTGDLSNMYNLTICLNNTKQYDSAFVVFGNIVAVDSMHVDALSGIGKYYNEMGRWAADSTKRYEAADNIDLADQWQAERGAMFDSARVYFGRAFEIEPTNAFNADMFALISAITGHFDDAARGYEQLTKLEPTNPDYWLNLGDCFIGLKDFGKSIEAYKKVVELDPENKTIWEQLANLYENEGMKAEETEARSHFE
jgi:tetratricopeptide (TPR) repeat protein